MTNSIGLYIHIPFCIKKCNYCDFYSTTYDNNIEKEYIIALIKEIKQWGGELCRPIDTVYFGGGTPSLIAQYLPQIMSAIKNSFEVSKSAEITMEMNPADNSETILKYALEAGINRISIGAQSGDDAELNLLGRRHTTLQTEKTVKIAHELGFNNISLDIMLGLPHSNTATLNKTLEFVNFLNPEHISAYILKIENGTLFGRISNTLDLPNDDNIAEQYLQMCDFFKNKNYNHYEISNFAKPNKESLHNLKYWQLCEYLGIGPAAHSFIGGKRFYYERNLKNFIKGTSPVFDGNGGDNNERIMLGLRLGKGVKITPNKKVVEKCKLLEKNGFLTYNDNRIVLTDKGFLLSNSIITEILECME